MSFRYHGNWCGPGWSDGRYVSSTAGFAPAIDEFDETCRQHDFALSGGRSDPEADARFVAANRGRGLKREFASLMVAGRASLDRLFADNKDLENLTLATMKKPALRGSSKNTAQRPLQSVKRTAAPVAIGSVIRAVKTQHIQTKNGAILRGTDFLAPVEGSGVATFGVGKSALLSPAYFLSTFLGNMARSFEKYRWNKLRIHYVPKVATSAAGQIVMCSSHSVSEPCLAGESGTFLQRAMSQGNAAMGPLWMENWIDIDVKRDFKMVDPGTTTDPDDAIAEELQVYVQTSVSGQVGYLYAEYEVEFTELTYQQHATSIPIPTGPGIRAVLRDITAVNAAGDDFTLGDPSNTLSLSTVPNGSILRAIFDLQGSTCYTGGTFATGFNTILATRSAVGTQVTTNQSFPIQGGTAIYFVVLNNNAIVPYVSLEAAVNGNGSGQLFYANASTVAGSYNFDLALIRYGLATLATVQ